MTGKQWSVLGDSAEEVGTRAHTEALEDLVRLCADIIEIKQEVLDKMVATSPWIEADLRAAYASQAEQTRMVVAQIKEMLGE